VKWYYAIGEQPMGPVDRTGLEALFTAGTIDTNTLIVQEGMYDWVPFRDLKKTTQFLFTVPDHTAEPKPSE
jgi:hypothetical protein